MHAGWECPSASEALRGPARSRGPFPPSIGTGSSNQPPQKQLAGDPQRSPRALPFGESGLRISDRDPHPPVAPPPGTKLVEQLGGGGHPGGRQGGSPRGAPGERGQPVVRGG